jgi:hypothetical protein
MTSEQPWPGGDDRRRRPRPPELPHAPAPSGDAEACIHVGWGRLLFGQTFADAARLVAALANEEPDERDIAVYVCDPHVALSLAPQDVFLDPSHTLRLTMADYRAGDGAAR